jgi:hypothetical protein
MNTLFNLDTLPKQTRKDYQAERLKRAKQALSRANELWVKEYSAFILQFARKENVFTAEDVRLAYCGDKSRVQTFSQQASGQIFRDLIKRGVLIKDGSKKSVIYGNLLQAYRLNGAR